ncbi:hypothetical protein GYMLUDRAFT_257778 [Collybiopsis luxurians FD-317 M1]|nr:hypothetical protein GYMLUDRAFT_257778 [Collybiopsis luxurians FD-317 M1]
MTIIIGGLMFVNIAQFEASALVNSGGVNHPLGIVFPGAVGRFALQSIGIPQGAEVHAGIRVGGKEVIDTANTFEYSPNSASYANFEIAGTPSDPTLRFIGV